MQIHQIKSPSTGQKKRVGRGGKKGTYSGRGGKGQTARSGFSQRATFEGGMSTLVARTKKLRGFRSPHPKNQVINLDTLESKFQEGTEVTVEVLAKMKLVRSAALPVKILSQGNLTKKLTIQGVLVSQTAKEKIEKAGGKVFEAAKEAK